MSSTKAVGPQVRGVLDKKAITLFSRDSREDSITSGDFIGRFHLTEIVFLLNEPWQLKEF